MLSGKTLLRKDTQILTFVIGKHQKSYIVSLLGLRSIELINFVFVFMFLKKANH